MSEEPLQMSENGNGHVARHKRAILDDHMTPKRNCPSNSPTNSPSQSKESSTQFKASSTALKSDAKSDTKSDANSKTHSPFSLKYTFSNEESITGIKISNDSSKLASCSAQGIIRVYNMEDGALSAVLQGHTKGISTLAFSPICSDILASGSDDLTIRIWSVSQQKCIRILKKHTYHITTLVFNSKGSILVSGAADETIIVWDLTSGKSLKTLAAHSDPVSSVCLTQDDSMIISASFDGLMRIFDTETGQCLKTLIYNSTSHGTATASTNDVVNFPISHITISPNSKYVLSTSLDGKLRLWDYMHNKVVKTFLGVDGVVNQKYCSGSCFVTRTTPPLVVSGSDSAGVLFWDLQMKGLVCRLLPSETILDVSISPSNDYLAVCSLSGSVHLYQWNGTWDHSKASD